MTDEKRTFTDQEALDFHRWPTPGKIGVQPTKPMATQRDLSLAYSPGVAVPVRAIAENPDDAYEYTSKGNLVAVISNGTAILGLGNLGALASKPVMEGKSVLFKRFADVDSIDIEVATEDADELITVVKNIGLTFGGINLEDIKSPECFVIETQLQELLDIPVFHDDQHGTAIISAAGLINACRITKRRLEDVKVVLNGPGAAGIATLELIKAMGVNPANVIAVDRQGTLWRGRTEDMNQWKSAHVVDTPHRTLAEAINGADCFIGLSAKGALTKDMVASMAKNPIIFAMANPDPEITPEEVLEVRKDAIMATGRSDYPNQVNNVLGFPYIFRGALDVRARRINHEMKIAAANALAELAREDVPDEVAAAYHGRRLKFGPEYIIPTPFDPRLISYVPPFVAQAAMDTGVARRPIEDMDDYRERLAQRLDPTAAFLQKIAGSVQAAPNKRIVFAEGEDPSVIRAACAFEAQGLGHAILVGRENLVLENMAAAGVDPADCKGMEIINARVSERNAEYVEHLYGRLQRQGYLRRDIQRLINQDRNSFAASMVALGHADGMVTGVTRNFDQAFAEVMRVIDPAPGQRILGMSIVLAKGRPIFVADTNVTEFPDAAELAEIARVSAAAVRKLGYTPRVAFMSYSSFGNPPGPRSAKLQEAVRILDAEGADFEYDGEMPPEVALDPAAAAANYPFMRLSEAANILIMPAIHSASISTRLVQALGGATVIGPLLLGTSKAVQIAPLSASVSQILTLATFAAYEETAERTRDGDRVRDASGADAPMIDPPQRRDGAVTPKRVFLLGATGTIGRATAVALVERGHAVTAFLRPRRPGADAALPDAVGRRNGDVADPASVVRDGFRGERFDAVMSCMASRTGVAADAWAVDHRAHMNVLDAARAAGVDRWVQLSAICVQKPRLAFQHAKLAFESELMASGLTWLIVRPTAYFKSLSGQVARVRAGKPYLVFGDGTLTACKPISDRDLAAYLADCLDDPSRRDAILPIGGPGPALTPRDQGEALFALLGRPPRFSRVPPAMLDAVAGLLGVAGALVPALAAKAELARIGRYYATESMLVLDPATGRYDADATPEFGADTLADYHARLIRGEASLERRDHAVF